MNKKIFSSYVFVGDTFIHFLCTTEWEDYDESKSHNGGSYYQPTHKIVWSDYGRNYTLTIEDTSCGDFGTRIYAQLDKDDCCIAQASYGSMVSQEFTDFNWADFDHATAILIAETIGRSGYHIPYAEG